MSAERLQKVLASSGIASRRDCEELISAGRVSVNGKVVLVAGTRVDAEQDEIAVDGRPIAAISPRSYVMLHKPTGVVSTADDPQGRPTVVEMVDLPTRLFPVGRLDYDSEGLLILTDDGELTQRLTHPSYQIEKEYRALLDQAPSADAIREWRTGVALEGLATAPAWVELLERAEEGAWVRVVLHEGRKRQIREVAKLLGYDVQRLIRVREGPLLLGDLPPGEWRRLTDEEVEVLWSHVGGRDSERPGDVADTDRAATPPTERPRARRAAAPADGDTAPTRRPARPSARRAAAEAPDAPDAANDQQPAPPARQSGNERSEPRRDDRPYEARGPRRDDRPYEARGPRRDDRPADTRGPRRDDRPADTRGPRRDDRPADTRGPRRDDRPADTRGPRRDDRPADTRGPRRDDRPADTRGPRRDDRPYDARGPRRDDRPADTRGPRRDDRPYDARGPRRDDRPYDARGPRRDDRRPYDARGPRRDDRPAAPPAQNTPGPGREESAGAGDAPRREAYPDPGNERAAPPRREDKRGPSREWQERSANEKRDASRHSPLRGQRSTRFKDRGMRRTGFPFRAPRPKDEGDERS